MTQGFDLDELIRSGQIAADWGVALAPVANQIAAVGTFLDHELADGRQILPAKDNIFRAFAAPLANARVLIVGQDPYPTPGHAIGLSFAVNRDVRPLPRSLNNMYKELASDLGIAPASHGDFTEWSDAGVMLLNRVLTVRAGEAGSHRSKGWEAITEHAIRVLAARNEPLVAILWGKDAAALEPLLGEVPAILSAHPSPLSASRGFFGSRPFSRANAALEAQGASPINWQLTDETCSLF